MGWRLEILHTTRVSYAGGGARLLQRGPDDAADPAGADGAGDRMSLGRPAPIWTYQDYWGTQVSSFDLQEPHDELTVTAPSHGRDQAAAGPRPGRCPGPSCASGAERGRAAGVPAATPRTTVAGEAGRRGSGRRGRRGPARGRGGDRPGGRASASPTCPAPPRCRPAPQEAWDQGQGVCQDIAHLAVALLRVAGLPARYVSGYLHLDPAARAGPGCGRAEPRLDRVLDRRVGAATTRPTWPRGERHVVVARGRDYADVPPLKGIYHGAPSVAPDVTVEITRL